MTVIADVHEAHEATFTKVGGRRVVDQYGRPERTHRAVRNAVGVIEPGLGVLAITGDDRHAFVDDAISNRVPTAEGEGAYALLLDPDGHVRTDLYVFDAGERLLLLTPPGEAVALAEDWREKTFIQDVAIEIRTDDVSLFGVHGPKATEKIASVLHGTSSPEAPLSFVRGELGDAGVTVLRDDGLAGDEGFWVVADADAGRDVFDTLENRGLNAAPFGRRTWESLTLEAGTPLFETELAGRIPNALGVRNAVDFEKGCFVGQEVVSRIENRGRPPERLVGLQLEEGGATADEDGDSPVLPDAGAAVVAGGDEVGNVTRAVYGPSVDGPIAFATLADGDPDGDLTVRVDGESLSATVATLPFYEGSDRSARIPRFPED